MLIWTEAITASWILAVDATRTCVLTMLAQFAGVGYIATVVSRLIGLTIVRERG